MQYARNGLRCCYSITCPTSSTHSARNDLVEDKVCRAERQFISAIVKLPGFAGWWKVAAQYFVPEFVREVATIEPIPLVAYYQKANEWGLGSW